MKRIGPAFAGRLPQCLNSIASSLVQACSARLMLGALSSGVSSRWLSIGAITLPETSTTNACRASTSHRYGPHIFHTNDEQVWQFVNRFGRFLQYEHRVKGTHKNRVFPVPINLMTMYLLWGVTTPQEAQQRLQESRVLCAQPRNLEEWMLHHVGRDLYELVVKGYTEKQWGRSCAELPARIIRRLPVRMTWDDRYHDHRFSGLPEDGYTNLALNMLDGIEVELGVDYLADRDQWDRLAKTVVYTGSIDSFFEQCHGDLQYRSLRFATRRLRGDVQGCPQLNYTASDVPFTRVIEWKHFERLASPETILTTEYPQEWSPGAERFYPISDERNMVVYEKYKQQAKSLSSRYLFGGRLGSYKYLDMGPDDRASAELRQSLSRQTFHGYRGHGRCAALFNEAGRSSCHRATSQAEVVPFGAPAIKRDVELS